MHTVVKHVIVEGKNQLLIMIIGKIEYVQYIEEGPPRLFAN